MLHVQWQIFPFVSPSISPIPFSHSQFKPPNRCYAAKMRIAQLAEGSAKSADTGSSSAEQNGPIELPPSTSPSFATSDEPTPIQTATSVLLTGAITVFLFRSLRRGAKRAKAEKFRSSGETKSLVEEAAESLKAVSLSSVNAKSPPSPLQTFLGALAAGAIAVILYKFTTTIESSLNRQAISDNYSVRQITITIRTIINGLCYLATFVFGANSLGLLLYSGQLAFSSFMEDSSSHSEAPSTSKSGDTDSSVISNANEDQNSENTQ